MLEILQYIFSDFWIFLGTVVLLTVIAGVFKNIRLYEVNHNTLYVDGKKHEEIKENKFVFGNLWDNIIKHSSDMKKK